jgi:hypothetical protein
MRWKRNPYYGVLLSYCRWRYFFGGFLVLFTAFVVHSAREDRFDILEALFPLCVTPALLIGHLREMLEPDRSRLTPGLRRAHLVMAGFFAAIFGGTTLVATSLITFGANGPHLAVISVALTAFAIVCLLLQARATLPLILLLIIRPYRPSIDRHFILTLPPALSCLMLASSIALLIAVGLRFTRFEQETSKTWEQRMLHSAGRLFARALWRVRGRLPDEFLAQRSFRALGGASPGAGEGLWRRASHWNAAWGIGQRSARIGMFAGCVLLTPRLYADEGNSVFAAALLLLLPLLALIPGAIFGDPDHRSLLAFEFLRPFARPQHVRSVMLVCAASVGLFYPVPLVVPLLGDWLVHGRAPSSGVFWTAVFVCAWIPTFFGVGIANLKGWDSISCVIACCLAYGVSVIFFVTSETPHGYPLGLFCAVMVGVGLAAARAAYRSWLNDDVG